MKKINITVFFVSFFFFSICSLPPTYATDDYNNKDVFQKAIALIEKADHIDYSNYPNLE